MHYIYTCVEVIIANDDVNITLFVILASIREKKMQIFFANNLKWILGVRRMTQSKLAELLTERLKKEVSLQKVNRIVNGDEDSRPELTLLRALPEILDVSLDDLVCRDMEALRITGRPRNLEEVKQTQ